MLRSKSGMHIQISTGGHLGARWKRCIFIIGAGCTKYIYIFICWNLGFFFGEGGMSVCEIQFLILVIFFNRNQSTCVPMEER